MSAVAILSQDFGPAAFAVGDILEGYSKGIRRVFGGIRMILRVFGGWGMFSNIAVIVFGAHGDRPKCPYYNIRRGKYCFWLIVWVREGWSQGGVRGVGLMGGRREV